MPLESTAERLKRILVLVPWVIANPGCAVADVCARFGISEEELGRDLEMLIVCGLPPFGPGDLIWAEMDSGGVVIEMADYLARPPRLTRQEALALLIMGRAVAELPGMEEAEALRSALDKLAASVAPSQAGETRDLADRVAVELEGSGTHLLGPLRQAIADSRRLRIVYYSWGRGEVGERLVDPLVLFGAAGYWYLRAFDHESGEERVFRLDRIREMSESGERFERPSAYDDAAAATGALFTPSPNDLEVVLDLEPEAAWMVEAVVHERLDDLGEGRARLHLRTPHLAWLVGLLLSVGPAARVVSPAALADAVRAEALRALAFYSS